MHQVANIENSKMSRLRWGQDWVADTFIGKVGSFCIGMTIGPICLLFYIAFVYL